MPNAPILDPASIDTERIVEGIEGIQRRNAQRYEFALLDAIVYADDQAQIYAGYHDIKTDAWWTRGHVPGRPLFPGVLQIEIAAQLASYVTGRLLHAEAKDAFLGFTGVERVKFRAIILPPARYVIVAQVQKLSPRRTIIDAQGFVDGKFVFEGEITGMKV
jgi:3-hydroxyacyl-[acyl-carrier-protein] dehydratase